MQRLCIFPKDIQVVIGNSELYGRYLIKKIKEHLNNQPKQVVTVEEFCQYLSLYHQSVFQQIG